MYIHIDIIINIDFSCEFSNVLELARVYLFAKFVVKKTKSYLTFHFRLWKYRFKWILDITIFTQQIVISILQKAVYGM